MNKYILSKKKEKGEENIDQPYPVIIIRKYTSKRK